MPDTSVFELSQPGSFADPLTEVLRNGARALLAQAVEAEVAALLSCHADKLTDDGRQRLVRHGHLPEREIMTGIGPVTVRSPRMRQAFNLALDFEGMNRQFFFGQYERIGSFFEGTELAATDLPQGLELQILEGLRDQVPAEVFKRPFKNPVGGNPEAVRANLREATRLLREAGYQVRNQVLVNSKTGEPLTVEFLVEAPQYERIALFYMASLNRLGIDASVRTVDQAQYENRLRRFDFDVIISAWPQSLSPGNEQRGYWGSQAADQLGSRNLAGIKNPTVDTLIDRIIFAKTRQELVAATRALDRVLLWNHYVVPQWTYTKERTLRWNRFGKPDNMPEFGAADFPAIWWWDADKAAGRQD